jgi:hypothetical protein
MVTAGAHSGMSDMDSRLRLLRPIQPLLVRWFNRDTPSSGSIKRELLVDVVRNPTQPELVFDAFQ